MRSEDHFNCLPKTSEEVDLLLRRNTHIDCVLGPSLSPDSLKKNAHTRLLRLLSIMHVVNRHWGVLFENLARDHLLESERFQNNRMYITYRNAVSDQSRIIEKGVSAWFLKNIQNYPFLISFKNRRILFEMSELGTQRRQILHGFLQPTYLQFEVSRENIINDTAEIVEKSWDHSSFWMVSFKNESGRGPGPTREFFTAFSQECQRYNLNIWLGKPASSQDKYVYSPHGLFPKPTSDNENFRIIQVIGYMMAKSLMEFVRMDFPLSHALCKCIVSLQFRGDLGLADLKDVMPLMDKAIQTLVDVLKIKKLIEADESLTPESRHSAISSITFDGCNFEDLDINFTLPGYPDMELKEGEDILLTPHNVEEYLKLLTWWLLHEGPLHMISILKHGFRTLISETSLAYFYPEEFQTFFSGGDSQPWSASYIGDSCSFTEFTRESPAVQYLLEVLSSLEPQERRLFLQFVTGCPTLPVGDLEALHPPLTIARRGADNPDLYLPSAMTCSNLLIIPEYTSLEVTREKLMMAITMGQGSFEFV